MSQPVTVALDGRAVADRFAGFDRLSVRQRKRWREILLSFEMRNQYDVYDGETAVLHVAEQGEGIGAFLKRILLGPLRPFEMRVSDTTTGGVLLVLRRPWRWIFHRLEVFTGDGQPLGAIEKRWSWVRRLYNVEGPHGEIRATLYGPLLRPWTFEIRAEGRALGTIQKRWSGLGKEMFTDADNFGVGLAAIPEPRLRALVFAATALIDVVHFERSKG